MSPTLAGRIEAVLCDCHRASTNRPEVHWASCASQTNGTAVRALLLAVIEECAEAGADAVAASTDHHPHHTAEAVATRIRRLAE